MKAPKFWTRRGKLARLVAPIGAVTKLMTARRVARAGFAPGIPVYCAGNASVGGSGKTILARDLLSRLPDRPFALTRGYGGRLAGPVVVNPALHTAREVGDEALLLAASGPAILARDRAAGARLAVQEGATAIVMDDGLQNPELAKDCSFLVIDGGYGFGNGFLLPAGPLREPVAAAAARCRAAVLIGPDAADAAAALPADLPVLRATLSPHCAEPLAGRAVIAFAGIGRPAKFFASVTELGGDIVGRHEFPDHHVYTLADGGELLAEAARKKAVLVTTEKDYVKLTRPMQVECLVVKVRLAWEDEAALEAFLA
jgi:tetraacyldisaccharide 4'-kinase